MIHAICFLCSFAVAIYGCNQIHDLNLSTGNYVFVVGLLILCIIIVLDYITGQLQTRSRQRKNNPRR